MTTGIEFDPATGTEGSTGTSLFDALRADAISDVARLRELYEQPGAAAAGKDLDHLTEQARALVACASLVFVASADAEGRCDVTPRGGPAGFVSVLDPRTLAIPDATGNRRLDTMHNVLATGRVGLLFIIPGRNTTLRANGRACISARPELLGRLTAVGKPPATALVVELDEVYPHCPKSLLRSSAWKPEEWLAADAQPSSAEVTLAQLRTPGLTLEDVRRAEVESLKYRYE
ncbi:MSMEG_1061 family FMN-dependent PPOX-type flavoprotein [Embleya sp. AB8]|uniref:MSMEG_1061 family FMN-dependent PPOX-type flavoprotein n=1 Tax=Embleya sp. AB8 TaxID=3156304 RepID=UPI003C70FB02